MQRGGMKFTRLGYKKILDTCQQVNKEEYEWMWVNTYCIDK